MMKPLDPFNIDLEKTCLIEASAGTGKTYTITTLVTRLVAMGYPVESILVVTFTEAAAAELKLRIRSRLSNTLAGLLSPEDLIQDDLAGFFRQDPDLARIMARLKLAVTCFDQAGIMTIHSFCLKVLKENAFESRLLFDIELVPDRSLFLRQVSYDFFMGRVNNMDPLFLAYLAKRQVTPESFVTAFGQVVCRNDLVCKPGASNPKDNAKEDNDPEDKEKDNFQSNYTGNFDLWRKALGKINEILLNQSMEIQDLISSHPGIDKRSYSKKNLPAWLEACRRMLETGGVETFFDMTEKGDALYKFTRTRLALKTKNNAPPEHEFFDLCEQIYLVYQEFETLLIVLKKDFLVFFNTELDKIKQADGICFFDDLVNDLAAALEKQDGVKLRQAVRDTYRACLIDEFQDTDPRQYDIFSNIFAANNRPFFMIGDPKQAIYAFRGGDIFAYLKASKESDQRLTLEKNYRSAPLLVAGINSIFSDRPNPFEFDAIEFSCVTTPETARNLLVDHEFSVPPLQFYFVKRQDHPLDRQGYIGKETCAKIIPEIVAADILSLLESTQGLNDKDLAEKEHMGKDTKIGQTQKISPKDIAVLVRTNLQAQQVQSALSRHRIPSFLSKTGSVFDSCEAKHLHDILWAVTAPDNAGYIRAALCTSVFDFSSEQLRDLDKKEDLFFQWQDRFREYKAIWETSGFVSMIMDLFHSDDAFLKENSNLEERGLTNFYHLVELISQASIKQQLSPYFLMKWVVRQLFPDLRDEASDELRLESDQKAVAIVTIHKSKGLEYPIVYLPYLWEGQRNPSREDILFHDPEKEHQLTLDLGSTDILTSMAHFEVEEKAEQRRLLYVALTRASAMCRIIWGGFKSVDTSALGSLLHPEGCKEDPAMIHDLEQLKFLADQSVLVQAHVPEPFRIFADEAAIKPELSPEKISREIRVSWKMSSFSAISHTSQPEDFQATGTANDMENNNHMEPIVTLADFPKGAGSGDLFHAIFEILDFTGKPKEISATIHSMFDRFGFLGPDLVQMGEASVSQILETPLIEGKSGFCLKDVRFDQRFNEMEFLFPIHAFQLSSLKTAFEQSDIRFKTSGYIDRLARLSLPAVKGFMKGFIDLVIQHNGRWYILDYKSNFLGNTYDQYSHDAMFDAMADHHYFLQYHIYIVALHRYLSLRLKDYDYDRDFGGVFYLFIRGMHPGFGSRYGVFFHRPEKAAVISLSDNLF